MKLTLLTVLFGLAVSPAALGKPVTVVELYQSQGCSSCPPAIKNINSLADKPDLLPLIFAVTYWDRLGWKDTFARPEFTARQWSYARGLHHEGVYTPQVVINGQTDLVGTNSHELAEAIRDARPLSGPAITVADKQIEVAAGAPANADVWLVRYDPRTINVQIGAGENSGVTIAHRNVVRQLIRLGEWYGAASNFSLPLSPDAVWRTAILIQEQGSKSVLSAAVI